MQMIQLLFFYLLFQSSIFTISVDLFFLELSSENLLIDVRTPKEFKEGHIEGALNISVLSVDFKEKINELPKEAPVYIYCRSGKRSKKAANQMDSLGFKKIRDLEGDILLGKSLILLNKPRSS
jgi:rhodanese-related sulfurtransferase